MAEEIQPPAAAGILGVIERLGAIAFLAGLSLLFVPTIIGTMIVPSLLHEEVDRKTLAALLLVARPGEVIAGKGLTGLIYLAILLPMAVAISGLHPAEPVLVAAAVALFGVWLVELGLVLGLVVERRTYETAGPVVSMCVLLLPAGFALGAGSVGLKAIAMLWPSAAAAWLLFDGLTGVELYTAGIWAILVLLGWLVVTYVILVALVRHREL